MSDPIPSRHPIGTSAYWNERAEIEASSAAKLTNEALSAHSQKHSAKLLKQAEDHEERSRRFEKLAQRIEQTGEIVLPAETDTAKLVTDGKRASRRLANSARSKVPVLNRAVRYCFWALVWSGVAVSGYWAVSKIYFNRCMQTEMPIMAEELGADLGLVQSVYSMTSSLKDAVRRARTHGPSDAEYTLVAVAWHECEERSLRSLIWDQRNISNGAADQSSR